MTDPAPALLRLVELITSRPPPAAGDGLIEQDLRALQLRAEGATLQQIAAAFGVSQQMVKIRLRRGERKLARKYLGPAAGHLIRRLESERSAAGASHRWRSQTQQSPRSQ